MAQNRVRWKHIDGQCSTPEKRAMMMMLLKLKLVEITILYQVKAKYQSIYKGSILRYAHRLLRRWYEQPFYVGMYGLNG